MIISEGHHLGCLMFGDSGCDDIGQVYRKWNNLNLLIVLIEVLYKI